MTRNKNADCISCIWYSQFIDKCQHPRNEANGTRQNIQAFQICYGYTVTTRHAFDKRHTIRKPKTVMDYELMGKPKTIRIHNNKNKNQAS